MFNKSKNERDWLGMSGSWSSLAGMKIGLIIALAPWLVHCGQQVEFGQVPELSEGFETPPGSNGPSTPVTPPRSADPFEKRQVVKLEAESLIDILFVVDNSGSMEDFQRNMSRRIQGFMAHVQGLNYQIAVTSTDPRPGAAWADGAFRSFNDDNSRFILRPSEVSNPAKAQRLLGQAIEMGANGSADERGIFATFRAIEKRHQFAPQAEFFRDQAALAVVLISDEDECSQGLRFCSSQDPEKSDPRSLLRLVEAEFGSSKRFVFHSIIFDRRDQCENAQWGFPGATYLELSQRTGGTVGSVCARNYAGLLSEIGRQAKDLAQRVNLECEPISDGVQSGRDKLVILDSLGQQVPPNAFELKKNRVEFLKNLPSGEFTFVYHCAELS